MTLGLHFQLTPFYARCFGHKPKTKVVNVATLTLGSQPKQEVAKVRAKIEAWESLFILPRVYKSVREWTLTLPSEFPR
jgi:hypothetical protein